MQLPSSEQLFFCIQRQQFQAFITNLLHTTRKRHDLWKTCTTIQIACVNAILNLLRNVSTLCVTRMRDNMRCKNSLTKPSNKIIPCGRQEIMNNLWPKQVAVLNIKRLMRCLSTVTSIISYTKPCFLCCLLAHLKVLQELKSNNQIAQADFQSAQSNSVILRSTNRRISD